MNLAGRGDEKGEPGTFSRTFSEKEPGTGREFGKRKEGKEVERGRTESIILFRGEGKGGGGRAQSSGQKERTKGLSISNRMKGEEEALAEEKVTNSDRRDLPQSGRA